MAERSAADGHSPMTGTVVTAAGPGMRAVLHDLALPTSRRWTGRQGWDVRAVDLDSDGAGAGAAAQAGYDAPAARRGAGSSTSCR